ncbi:extracellular solute-binding protein [Pseudoclavibacter sp. JSM 162008]|uniref:extracellular solute-binding protein n=1 Tax=Pseudoclavibacter sp. JSM 162008 TaxID=3229855 RepID=UPI0035242AB7
MRNTARRPLAAAGLLATSGLLLVGCTPLAGSTDAADVPLDLAPPVAGEIAPGALDGINLVYAGNGGVIQEGQTSAIWDPFAEESGATVQQDSYELTKLKAMVDSDNVSWNMVNSSILENERYCGELFEKIDPDKVDLSNAPEGTVAGECTVPNIFMGYVVAYNTDVYGDNGPKSAADFFDTAKFPGKRGVPLTPWMEAPAIEFAMLADGADFDNLTVDDFHGATDLYDSLGENLVPWTSGAQSQQQLESGEVDMSLVWSGRGFGAANAGAPIAGMWEEWVVNIDGIAIPKGTPNLDASYAAVNYLLGADQQAAASEATSYAPVNVNAVPDVPELTSEWLVSNHLESGHNLEIDYWVDNWDELADAWTTWVAGG